MIRFEMEPVRVVPCVKERPPFGPDRLEADRVRPGTKIIVHHTGVGYDQALTIVGMPWQDDRKWLAGTWWVEVEDESGHRNDSSLSDIGVIPYRSGLWNSVNWAEVVS